MNKYHAVAVIVDGYRFASKREARRWQDLKLLVAAGAINGLRRQVSYVLHACDPRGHPVIVGRYIVDFDYWTVKRVAADADAHVLEDAKGVRTALYRWKAKHLTIEYGLTVREV